MQLKVVVLSVLGGELADRHHAQLSHKRKHVVDSVLPRLHLLEANLEHFEGLGEAHSHI